MRIKIGLFIACYAIMSWGNDNVLEKYIGRVLEKNPHIKTSTLRTESIKASIRAEKEIPNPIFVIGTPINSKNKMYEFSISQSIPWPGTIIASKRVVQSKFESSNEYLKDQKNDVLFKLREECVNLFTINQKIKFLNENLGYLKEAKEVTETKYKTGDLSQLALLKIELEIAGVEDKVDQLKKDDRVIRSELGELLELEVDSIEIIEKLPQMSVPALENAIKLSIEQNPEINSYEYKVKTMEDALLLSKQKLGPGITASTKFKSQDQEWSVMGGISIPLWIAPKIAEIKEKELIIESTKKLVDEKKAELKRITATMHHNYIDALRQIELFEKKMIPLATQTFELSMTKYLIGEASTLDMLDALRMVNDYKIKKANQEARREIMAAEIVICCLGQVY